MAYCTVHPAAEAAGPCSQCGRPFCGACLAPLLGGVYCATCKERAVRNLQQGKRVSQLSVTALVLSILNVMICSSFAPLTASLCLYLGRRALAETRAARPGARTDIEHV